MSVERHGGIRIVIAEHAARIMVEEGVKQYFTAKRIAARRVLGRAGAKQARFRPRDLPSNGEVRDAVQALVEELEGDARTRRLFAMRVVALEAMHCLERFSPRLIGSVATGHVRAGSDVDLHVFADDAADVVSHVAGLGWTHEVHQVDIVKHGRVLEFTHVVIADLFEIELTVYAPRELRHRPRSSTDGKPIVRLGVAALRALCEAEHPEAWRRYQDEGMVPSADELIDPTAAESRQTNEA